MRGRCTTSQRPPGRSQGRRSLAAAGGLATLVVVAACGSSHHRPTAAPATAPSTVAPTTAPPVTRAAAPLPTAPLTDLPQPVAAQLRAPAVVVKIDNVLGAFPQTGVGQADVVYEEMVEGGLTRLAAVYQSHYPKEVGPVRSGRLTDIAIVDDLDHPVLAFAGANGLFLPQLRSQPIEDIDIDNHGEMFVRHGPNAAPHDLYTDPAADAALDDPSRPPAPLFAFHPTGTPLAGAGAVPATSVTVDWPSASATWTYSSASGVWSRDMNGAPDTDSSGHQLIATNIVVQAVSYPTVGEAYESGVPTPLPEGILTGSGPAWVLSGGRTVTGTWQRSSVGVPTTYLDGAGHPISLAPGSTWVELIVAGTAPRIS